MYSGYGLFRLLLRWGPTFRRTISKILKMEALRFSSTLVVHNKITRCHIPEEDIRNSYIRISTAIQFHSVAWKGKVFSVGSQMAVGKRELEIWS